MLLLKAWSACTPSFRRGLEKHKNLKLQASTLKFTLPKIYPITDVRRSRISHGEQVAKLIEGGAELIQLREKYASPRDFHDAASEAIETARNSGARIIVNDRADIALAAKADGVHLGQDDLPPEMARKILGDDAIIGFSTHSVDQAIAAMDFPLDYIAIGPIFRTSTKESPGAVVGLDGLRTVRQSIGNFPLVAIGGIDAANIREVFAAGADSAAMIGALIYDSQKITERIWELIDISSEK